MRHAMCVACSSCKCVAVGPRLVAELHCRLAALAVVLGMAH
jgi:hypothetical protein